MPKQEYQGLSGNGLLPVFICSDNGDGTYTGLGDITSEGDIALPVTIKTSTDPLLDLYFIRAKDDSMVLDVEASADSYSFAAPSGHGIVVGDIVELGGDDALFIQALVVIVSVDTITLNAPLNKDYPIGSALLVGGSNMQLVTIATPAAPVVFSVKPRGVQAGDMYRMFISITSTSDQGFQSFGSAAALTYGLTVRVKEEDGTYRNIFTFRTNGEFQERALDSNYQVAIGNGDRGFTARRSFDRSGSIIRLDGVKGEELQIVVAEPLNGGGNTIIQAVCQGHEH
jgi:hypothetical protein